MAGWLKQGLSTLGEGISTLTKEILAEEPPDHHGHSTNNSATDRLQNTTLESLGSRAEIERLRALVADMEDRASRAEAQATSKFCQMVREFENVTASQREQISELENRLDSSSQHGMPESPHSTNQVNTDPDVFRDIDLLSGSPPPDCFPVQVVAAQSASPTEGRHRTLSHKESLDSGLLDAMELELIEKDSTIRHLTQEISRSRAVIAQLEAAAALPSTSKSDVEVQTLAEETGPPVVTPLLSDQSVQSDDSFLLDPDTAVKTSVDVATMCEIRAAVSHEGVQVEEDGKESSIGTSEFQAKASDATAVEVQTDVEIFDRGSVDTVDSGVQFESESLDTESQTDLLLSEVRPLTFDDAAAQCDSVISSIVDQETQYDLTEERSASSTQTEAIQIPLAEDDRQTSEAAIQTVDVSSISQETQSSSDLCDRDSQCEISGDITLFEDYTRIVQESQTLHSQLGTLTSSFDRSRKEVDRLRAHLLQVEQGFALDFQLAQQREGDLRDLVQQLESQVAVGNASEQFASQEVQAQVTHLLEEVRVLTEARDIFVSKLHGAEKKNSQLEASLSNLRLAVDHIKLENRAEIEQEKEKGRKSLRNLDSQIQSLTAANADLSSKLAESGNLLQANNAAISEADTMRRQYADLLRQLEEKDRLLLTAHDEAASVSRAKVDIALMKSMLMGYLIGPKNCQADILRMMMSTLNFDDRDRQKVHSNQTSTLRSLFSAPSGKLAHEPDDSFSNMLVKFIEQESKPKVTANGLVEAAKEPLARISSAGTGATDVFPPSVGARSLNSQRSFAATGSTGRPNTATDPSMAQDRMLEDILNGPADVPSKSRFTDIV